jgi:hypothetical protein
VTTVATTHNAAIKITKQANIASATVGEVITYTYNVSNEGNVNLSNIVSSDSRGLILTYDGGDTNGDSKLNLSEIWNYTATYRVTEADACGPITNTATVTSDPFCPEESGATDTSDPVTTVATTHDAALTIDKTADFGPKKPANVGQTISYIIAVKNAGDVTLTKVNVTDRKLGLIKQIPTLMPQATETISASYKVTESDLCGKGINNEAVANATDPCGSVLANVSSGWSVPTDYTAAIKIDKSAEINNDSTDLSPAKVGDVINYTYNVTNTGNVDLSNVEIEDDKLKPTKKEG